jgi:hypothetical protein
MKAFWNAYASLYTWQTGIPIAFNAAIAIAVIVYTTSTSTYMRLKHSLNRGVVGFVLAYIFVLLLIVSKMNIDAMWWSDENLRNQVAAILAFILAIIITVIISVKGSLDGAEFWGLGCFLFVILALLFLGVFTVGDVFFFSIHYVLYILALIGFPTLSIVAAIFMFSKLDHRGVMLPVFCYITFSACTAVTFLLSSDMASYLAPLLFLSGPFVLMIIIFHFRQTFGTWIVGISGLFIITSIQLIMVRSPLFDNFRNVFRTSNLTWILVIYAASTLILGTYYLRTLYRNRVEKKVENLHPILAIGAVVYNVCFLYPVIASNYRWLWGLCFVAVNLFIGLIILLGRFWVLIRIQRDKEIMEKVKS